jgi:transcriptional regulator with XRE-family HTH domain
MPLKQKYKNRLFLIRNKSSLTQKQVAFLLNHKTVDQISRYERGVKLPSLKTAFKLGIIFRIPIQVLFYDYYEACLDELKNRKKVLSFQENDFNLIEDSSNAAEFCTFEEKLKSFAVSEIELNKVRHHIAKLVEARGRKMKHFSNS